MSKRPVIYLRNFRIKDYGWGAQLARDFLKDGYGTCGYRRPNNDIGFCRLTKTGNVIVEFQPDDSKRI